MNQEFIHPLLINELIIHLTFNLNSPFECFLLLRIVPALMSAQSALKWMIWKLLESQSVIPYLKGSHSHVGQQIAQVDLCSAGGGELAV